MFKKQRTPTIKPLKINQSPVHRKPYIIHWNRNTGNNSYNWTMILLIFVIVALMAGAGIYFMVIENYENRDYDAIAEKILSGQ